MRCPLCQSESTEVFRAKGFPVHDCVACGHRFAAIAAGEEHVSSTYDDSYFFGGGAGYSDYAAEADMLRRRGADYARIISSHRTEKGSLLDVGAAAGFILRGFVDEGWRGVGLEPNEKMAGFGREQLGLAMHHGSLETFATAERFDVVSMIQVAAHFYDPVTVFTKAARLLNDRGLLLIETWNRASLTARLFGRHWHEYSPPSVLHWFSEEGLTAFLGRHGFVKMAGGRPSKKISGAHARSLLRYRIGDNFLLRLIPEHVDFPYPAEDLFWHLYQKK